MTGNRSCNSRRTGESPGSNHRDDGDVHDGARDSCDVRSGDRSAGYAHDFDDGNYGVRDPLWPYWQPAEPSRRRSAPKGTFSFHGPFLPVSRSYRRQLAVIVPHHCTGRADS
jgi:hypothetical protein